MLAGAGWGNAAAAVCSVYVMSPSIHSFENTDTYSLSVPAETNTLSCSSRRTVQLPLSA